MLGLAVAQRTKKRVVKLTAKALSETLDRLQLIRKIKLNKANHLKENIRVLTENHETVTQASFHDFVLCDETITIHSLLPYDENEKHETWFNVSNVLLSVLPLKGEVVIK